MEAISLPLATLIINLLGMPGVIFIIWHFDNKRDQRKDELRRAEIAEREQAIAVTLAQYKEDVAQIKRLYENNAELVRDYNKVCDRQDMAYKELISVVSLNTQASTQLTDAIKNNTFCPALREKMPQALVKKGPQS